MDGPIIPRKDINSIRISSYPFTLRGSLNLGEIAQQRNIQCNIQCTTQCTVSCTTQCTISCTTQCTIQFTYQFTTLCTIQCTTQCTNLVYYLVYHLVYTLCTIWCTVSSNEGFKLGRGSVGWSVDSGMCILERHWFESRP